MPGNPRTIFNRSITVAVLICAFFALFWPASHLWSEGIRIAIGPRRYELTTGPGWIAFTNGPNLASRHYPPFENTLVTITPARRSALAYTRIYSAPGDYRFYFPLWMLSIISSIVVIALTISSIRRRLKYNPQICEACGYDLRATPARCPECGNIPA